MARSKLLSYQHIANYVCQGKGQNIKRAATHGELALGNLLKQKLHLFKDDIRTLSSFIFLEFLATSTACGSSLARGQTLTTAVTQATGATVPGP